MGVTTKINDRERAVIKIGGSVLPNDEAYDYQARRVAAFVENGGFERVYVVVSARKGKTDALADSLCGLASGTHTNSQREELRSVLKRGDYSEGNHDAVETWDNSSIANYFWERGELESTMRFGRALGELCCHFHLLTQTQTGFPIVADTHYLHADVDFEASQQKASNLDNLEMRIVLIPGFAAQKHNGEVVLLGRNASDYVAAMIGWLDPLVNWVIYLKNVEGVFRDFGGPTQKLVERVSSSELRAMGPVKVLDERCLDAMRDYKIRVQHQDSEIGVGGTVIYT